MITLVQRFLTLDYVQGVHVLDGEKANHIYIFIILYVKFSIFNYYCQQRIK